MYIVVSDCTNEKADIYNSIEVVNDFESHEEAVMFAEQAFLESQSSYRGTYEWQTKAVDTARYFNECTGAEIYPEPDYVIGETDDGSGEIYHIYFMVIDVPRRKSIV